MQEEEEEVLVAGAHHRLGWCRQSTVVVAAAGGDGSSHCNGGAVQGFPIGQLEHQNKGQTSWVAAEVGPIEPSLAVVEATLHRRQDPDEQN